MSHTEAQAIIARNEKIERLIEEKIELVRERDHLQGIIDTAMGGKKSFEDRMALLAKIERLRAALEDIGAAQWGMDVATCRRIARKALDGPTGSD